MKTYGAFVFAALPILLAACHSAGSRPAADVLFLPGEQARAEGLQVRGTSEWPDIGGVSRLDTADGRAYYVIDTVREVETRARAELANPYPHGADLTIVDDFGAGAYIHVMLEGGALARFVYFTFPEWPAVQLTSSDAAMPAPGSHGALNYREYRIPASACASAAPLSAALLAGLREGLESVGEHPATEALADITVDGPSYRVTARLQPFGTAVFGLGASSARRPFEAAASLVREVRACAQSHPYEERRYEF